MSSSDMYNMIGDSYLQKSQIVMSKGDSDNSVDKMDAFFSFLPTQALTQDDSAR